MKNYIYLILMVMNLISCGRNEHVSQLKNSGTSQKLGFKLIKNVPYYLQGDNRYEPSNTCGLTSLAMIASYNSRIRYSSDYLYKKYRKRMGQDPLSAAKMLRQEGFNAKGSKTGTLQSIFDLIDRGRPIVIFTWMGKRGHIAVVTGYDSKGLFINDPAGRWNGGYKSSNYSSSDKRKNKYYPFSKLTLKVLGGNGHIWHTWIDG